MELVRPANISSRSHPVYYIIYSAKELFTQVASCNCIYKNIHLCIRIRRLQSTVTKLFSQIETLQSAIIVTIYSKHCISIGSNPSNLSTAVLTRRETMNRRTRCKNSMAAVEPPPFNYPVTEACLYGWIAPMIVEFYRTESSRSTRTRWQQVFWNVISWVTRASTN